MAQNGTYRCNSTRFEDEKDPTRNKSRNNSFIITIEINDITGGSVLVTWLDDNTIYKWVVRSKLETTVNEQGVIFTSYDARFSFENVQGDFQSIVILVQDPKNNSLHFAVFVPVAKTTTWYYNLTKVDY